MKNILILLTVFLIFSCKDDDDSITNSEGLIPLELTKNFLVNEKWFLDAAVAESPIDINGDGTETTDLMSQFPACDLDSFYQFERLQEDRLVLVDDENICEDFDDRYVSQVYPFDIDAEGNKLNINLRTSQLLGGLENSEDYNDIDGFFNVQFLISPDSQFKIIRGEVQYILDSGNIVTVDYSLKASIDNRPEISL